MRYADLVKEELQRLWVWNRAAARASMGKLMGADDA